jgi:CheY-like chemotaxis protein
MPEMDGHEFAQALRRLPEPTCSIPVISMSGTEIPLSKVYASGIDAHLRKPFSLDDLNFLITAVTGNPAFIGGS